MNPPHAHTWSLINSALRRYRCVDPSCNAVGHAGAMRRVITPYACQYELDTSRTPGGRKHCGKPATHVTHLRTAHRCAEHAPQPAAMEQAS